MSWFPIIAYQDAPQANQVAVIRSGLPQFLCVDLANQQRNGFVQIPVVDLSEQPSQDSYTESFRLNNPDELGPTRIGSIRRTRSPRDYEPNSLDAKSLP